MTIYEKLRRGFYSSEQLEIDLAVEVLIRRRKIDSKSQQNTLDYSVLVWVLPGEDSETRISVQVIIWKAVPGNTVRNGKWDRDRRVSNTNGALSN